MSVQKINQMLLDGYEFTHEDIEQLRGDRRKFVQEILGHGEKLRRERERIQGLYQFERELYEKGIKYIAGIDEAGRGPLAGPVVAGAVILPAECFISGLNDSKKIPEPKRYLLEKEIKEKALAWSVGAVGAHDIDRINIYQAACLAMVRAVKKLSLRPEHLFIDALSLRSLDIPQTPIIKGDARSASIAAASILAKCHRDRLMTQYDSRFPDYGFIRHKGYPTPEHIEIISRLGRTCIHRMTFHVPCSDSQK
ncbi:ribonuclease HII [Candidatus Formimonas warabiya]|uniref:Ribonuclease HII n=2 Tax=Formimonas warabiya TaxID=1761012 RepID=A0A3G1L1A2_FORW1|nr:ribonuclease HII [Candidatus Formimonas warabiya]